MKIKLVTDSPDYYILWDEDGKFKAGDIAYSVDNDYYTVSEDDIAYADINHYKVVGHLPKGNNPILKDIPLLPAITGGREEEKNVGEFIKPFVYEEAKKSQAGNPHFEKYWETAWGIWWGMMDTSFQSGLIKAFKAASKGMYTEDDIASAFIAGMDYSNEVYSHPRPDAPDLEEYMKSLPAAIPTPIDFILSDKYSTLAENIANGKYIYSNRDMEGSS